MYISKGEHKHFAQRNENTRRMPLLIMEKLGIKRQKTHNEKQNGLHLV